MIKTKRDLNQAIWQMQSDLTDEQVFGSQEYHNFLGTIISGVTRKCRCSIKLEIISENKDTMSYTTGNTIVVNRNGTPFLGLSRSQKHSAFIATILHEAGHILLTPFPLLIGNRKKLAAGDPSLFTGSSPAEEHLRVWLEKNPGHILSSTYNYVVNVLEDGYIDQKVIAMFPGYGTCRIWYRERLFENCDATYKIAKQNASNPIDLILSCVLNMGKFGVLHVDAEDNDPIAARLQDLIPLFEEATHQDDSVKRFAQFNRIFAELFSLMEDFFEQPEESSTSNDAADNASETQEKNENGMEPGAGKTSKNQHIPENNADFTQSTQEKKDTSTFEEMLTIAMQSISSEMDGEDNHFDTETISSILFPGAGLTQQEKGNRTMEENVSCSEIHIPENLLKQIAYNEVAKEQEEELTRNELEKLSNIKEENVAHQDITSIYIRQDISYNGEDTYKREAPILSAIANRMAKNLEKQIQERQIGDTLTGLYTGQRLSSHEVYRKDKKIFCSKKLPEDIPDMEVILLCDLSGSMGCDDGQRIKVAQKTSYVLYEFCRKMDIPYSIYGHSTQGHDVVIYGIASKDSLDKKDAKRIFSMKDHGTNRDGYAIQFCVDKLAVSDAATKILFIISDGLPNHGNYRGTIAKNDIQRIVSSAIKKGILVIAAMIGEDAAAVRGLYQDGISPAKAARLIDITDLDRLPKIFPSILRRKLEE